VRLLVHCVLAAIGGASIAAHAAPVTSWKVVARSDDGLVTFSLDPASVARGPGRTARLLYDYRDPQVDDDMPLAHRSTVVTVRVECRERRIASMSSIDYAGTSGTGKIVRRADRLAPVALRFVDAPEGSIDARVVDAVCAVRR
jgi:hypothetical protein